MGRAWEGVLSVCGVVIWLRVKAGTAWEGLLGE
jgi:hypothetical protein